MQRHHQKYCQVKNLCMKKVTTCLFLLFAVKMHAQRTEYSIALNSGLFSFTGKSATSTSFINYNGSLNYSYTNNPFGSQSGLSYGLSGNVKRISKHYFLVGFDLGYERLISKTSINSVSASTATMTYGYDASGKTMLNFDFINFQPFAGYRINAGAIILDVTAGMDIAFCLNATEKGNATSVTGTEYSTNVNRKNITTDLRPRVQLSAHYRKTGIYLGYSLGLYNYQSGIIGGSNDCYSRMLRFGVAYRLR